jgi:hypothetical protein
MKQLALDTQSFENLRNNECVYVDKTEIIYRIYGRKDLFSFASAPVWKIAIDNKKRPHQSFDYVCPLNVYKENLKKVYDVHHSSFIVHR